MPFRPARFAPALAMAALAVASLPSSTRVSAAPVHDQEETIDIVHGEERTIYEYRRNGILRIIKVVPKRGRPYYLMPVDAIAPFEGLEYARRLYPRWVIVEW